MEKSAHQTEYRKQRRSKTRMHIDNLFLIKQLGLFSGRRQRRNRLWIQAREMFWKCAYSIGSRG